MKNYLKTCEACGKKMIYLYNANTLAMVPVDYETLTTEEKRDYHEAREILLNYNPAHHVSHFKTCTDPGRFSGTKKLSKPKPGDWREKYY